MHFLGEKKNAEEKKTNRNKNLSPLPSGYSYGHCVMAHHAASLLFTENVKVAADTS